MKTHTLRNLFITLAAAMALLIGVFGALQTQAQEPGGKQPQADPTFTYQGRLTQGTTPYSGTCDFDFSLYDAETGGTQIGSVNNKTGVTVKDGYFNVELFFGNTAFEGSDRYLNISVNCGGGAVTLTPRAKLTRAPQAQYARNAGSVEWSGVNNHPTFVESAGTGLSLSAATLSITPAYRLPQSCANGQIAKWNSSSKLWQCDTGSGAGWSPSGNSGTTYGTNFIGTTDNVSVTLKVSNTTALRLGAVAGSDSPPNIIGGHSGNSVSADKVGAVIGGGGLNGLPNVITASLGVIGGGYNNTVTGNDAVVGGGKSNTAGGVWSTVAGGNSNTAGAMYATVGGGDSNTAGGYQSTIGGGGDNIARSDAAAIGGGQGNSVITGAYGVIGGGLNNTASGDYAAIPGGREAVASHTGEMAYANGGFLSNSARVPGTAQASLYVMRNTTVVSGAWQDLYLDGFNQRLTVAVSRTIAYDILVAGRSNTGESAGYYCWGAIENTGGTTALVGGVSTCFALGEDDTLLDVQVIADNALDALLVQVKGVVNSPGETFRWVATVRAAEVAW